MGVTLEMRNPMLLSSKVGLLLRFEDCRKLSLGLTLGLKFD